MIKRNIEPAILSALADTPVVLLNGARQTGKTTLARSIAARTGARYLSFDDAATLALAAADPAGFIAGLPERVVLDEVQKAPALFPAIKLAVDERRRPGRFLLTASASVLTLPRLADSLAGRMEIVPLFPFSAAELAGRREGFLARLFSGRFASARPSSPAAGIEARLACGGYPEAVRRQSSQRRAAWFSSYVSTILLRDVRDLARVDGLVALPNLLRLLAARTSGLLNLADVARDAGLPHATATRYLALLESVFMVHRLPAWSENLGRRLVKSPKLHVIDSGLACHVLGVDARRLAADRPLLGRMLETFVVGELLKQRSWSDPRSALYHLRTSAGFEVDAIIERPDGSVAGVEVKSSATAGPEDFAGLRSLRDQLGERFMAGVVLYSGHHIVPSGDRLWLLPLPALWTA